ncbi:histidine phosphatase family protein [Pseudomonas sp. DTU_2021_1001937_2_SI_NGA_ILE_001]|uniref:lipopolysaccharide core heptose(II)-phosphate phosphatase PmrG n=1 Tax=Pseudomonas sp. DTU_2021_1001937_2_SI_NGA_ILE_001 TaxID=3077589 RepID=UPI0028FC31D8|nr:histidine phosphatase family protein [Pseudomonas sp. DTU_2021_1001937_2_SI_NGA_ILE_001]WNW12959.1 histidine phosphatase family protein [Pseudomonas sp. DTU_2021_1001937_2_SI_NGA_ILE_001]
MALPLDTVFTPVLRPSPTLRKLLRGLAFGVLLLTALAAAWFFSRGHVVDLGQRNAWLQSGAYAQWQQGNVIVLMRHAERCDQSSNACLGPADGITVAGTQVAQGVGDGLAQLGLSDALLLASPLTRTRQTANFVFGKEVASAAWAGSCDADFAGSLLANKLRHRNLVLVTHSGCIDHLLRKLNVQPGERETDYAEAVMVSVNDQGQPHLLGSLKADQWHKIQE